jgi:cardiolipin synthase
LQAAGVQVLWFRRDISAFTFKRNRMRRLRRLHRKLAVIDQAIAYVGGINIIDDGHTAGETHAPRFDYAVRVEGLMAKTVQVAMAHLWNVVRWATLRQREPKVPNLGLSQLDAGSPDLRLILRDNIRHRRDIERAYLNAISHARHEIIIANAYFLPGRIFLRALLRAAQRGVKVVLLLQGKVEYRLQHYATRALYEQLLAAGIHIYEYQASYLHAKVAVVDRHWATVGSSNIDPLSLLLAREANLLVRDSKFAEALRSSLLVAVARGGKVIAQQEMQRTAVFSHLLTRASYALVRFLLGMMGYSKR